MRTLGHEKLIADLIEVFGQPQTDMFSLEKIWTSDNGKYRLAATYNSVVLYSNSDEFNEDNEDAEEIKFITSLASLPFDFKITKTPTPVVATKPPAKTSSK